MEYDKFYGDVCKILNSKLPLDKPGAILYTSLRTVQEGDFYILGLNPGGKDNPIPSGHPNCAADISQKMTIKASLEKCQNENYNEYSEVWKCSNGAGNMTLQKNLKSFAINILHKEIQDICCTNLIFKTTENQSSLNLKNDGGNCWGVHEMLLGIIKPKLIIAFGNGDVSPYKYLLDMFCEDKEEKVFSTCADHGNYRIKGFEGVFQGVPIYVLGLPHLSRYWVTSQEKHDVINEFLDRYIPHEYLMKWREFPIDQLNDSPTKEKCGKTTCLWATPNSQLKT